MNGRCAKETICFNSSTLLLPARRVDVHRDGEGLGFLHERELFADRVPVPRLDGRYAAAAIALERRSRTLDDLRVGAVAGKGEDARVCTRAHKDTIISKIVVFVPVVKTHRAHRRGECRNCKRPAKERERGVHRRIFADGVHVDADLAPLFRVADKARAFALGAGAGNGVAAGLAVAVVARLAVRPNTGPCVLQHFLISHVKLPLSE